MLKRHDGLASQLACLLFSKGDQFKLSFVPLGFSQRLLLVELVTKARHRYDVRWWLVQMKSCSYAANG